MKKLFIAAIVLSILTSWFSIGRYHVDEQYQILEFAAYKTGANAAAGMPWEFKEKIRPATQVAFVYVVVKSFEWLGITDPFIIAFILRLCASALGLIATYFILTFFRNKVPEKLFIPLCFLSLFYCFIPYFHARFSSENISSSLFFIGLFGILTLLEGKNNPLNLLWFAFLMGMAGVIRLQVDFLSIGFFAWLIVIKKENFKIVALMIFGVLAANLSGVVIDHWFYGSWEFTSWNYIYNNIVLNKAARFGSEPFWFYLVKVFLEAIPPFSILILFAFIYFMVTRSRSYLTWCLVPFLLAHFVIAHKELRFLFVLLSIVPLIAVLSYEEIVNSVDSKFKSLLKSFNHRWFRYFFLTVNTVSLFIICFKPADNYTPILRFLYSNYNLKPTVFICEKPGLDPYHDYLELHFYRSRTIVRTKASLDELPIEVLTGKSVFLYICEDPNLTVKNGLNFKRVYTSLPPVLLNFNINHWVERTGITCIYEIVR